MKVAICTGGGDAPGLNAVIRAAVLTGVNLGWEMLGSRRGFGGFLGDDRMVELDRAAVRGITHLGGTILGTTNRGNPFAWPLLGLDGQWTEVDRSEELVQSFRDQELDALIVAGGDGSLRIALDLVAKGIPIVGVPKTIDNDVCGTDVTFGFDTAVSTATDAIDKLHTTAESHERVMVVEVMGRDAGWIALHSGVAGTADVILIPEIPYDPKAVADKIREREGRGRPFAIVVVAEGALPVGGSQVVEEAEKAGKVRRLGGIRDLVASQITEMTGKETRTISLGHLQRGGSPTTFDRLLALRFGAAAIRAVERGEFGNMVALRGEEIVTVPIVEAIAKQKKVPLASDIVAGARDMGICLGDG